MTKFYENLKNSLENSARFGKLFFTVYISIQLYEIYIFAKLQICKYVWKF